MHTVIRRYTGSSLREVVKQNEKSLREAMAAVPGLRGYYLMEGNGEIASVTVCDTREGTQESNKRAAAWVKEHVPASANLSSPDVFEGETILEVSTRHAMA
jgi:hypothetical protein